jgi:hypothetical protein
MEDVTERPLTLGKRKRLRLRLLPKTRAYPINPARQYERDCEMVLRAVGRYIQSRGFCPNTKALSRSHTWNLTATLHYLEDLHAEGYLEVAADGGVWNLTEAGWDFIHIEPIVPIVPMDLSANVSSIREMREVLASFGTPETQAAYDTFARERRPIRDKPVES